MPSGATELILISFHDHEHGDSWAPIVHAGAVLDLASSGVPSPMLKPGMPAFRDLADRLHWFFLQKRARFHFHRAGVGIRTQLDSRPILLAASVLLYRQQRLDPSVLRTG